jgi:hypothetical protein
MSEPTDMGDYWRNGMQRGYRLRMSMLWAGLAIGGPAMAGNIYEVKYENQADVKVFRVKYQNQADLCVPSAPVYGNRARTVIGNLGPTTLDIFCLDFC